MGWERLGRVFSPESGDDWMRSHAALPIVEPRGGDVFRVYFGSRDDRNRTSIGWAEIEIGNRIRLLDVAKQPILRPGELGTFDDSGASPACLVSAGTKRYLYYVGWNLCVTVPWRNSIGLAISEDEKGGFTKYAPAPIVDRSAVDPFTLSYPWVIRDAGRWKMWYGSHLSWGPEAVAKHDMNHVIKYAESADGIVWKREGVVALRGKSSETYAVCRPCILPVESGYQMWFCHRGSAYEIGYAESANGIDWEWGPPEHGLTTSDVGWDSEMTAYPCVFEHRGRRFLLYNGNGYGKTGFGAAVWE